MPVMSILAKGYVVIAFFLLIPASLWCVVLLIRKGYINSIDRLKAASRADDPQVIVGTLDRYIRSASSLWLGPPSERPPVQDIEAYYDYYHNSVMRKMGKERKISSIGIREGIIIYGFLVLIIYLTVVFLFHLSLITFILYVHFVAIFASFQYAISLSMHFWQESRSLFFEIDLRFTSIMHPGSTFYGPPLTPFGA